MVQLKAADDSQAPQRGSWRLLPPTPPFLFFFFFFLNKDNFQHRLSKKKKKISQLQQKWGHPLKIFDDPDCEGQLAVGCAVTSVRRKMDVDGKICVCKLNNLNKQSF